jgi:hypothetical protein
MTTDAPTSPTGNTPAPTSSPGPSLDVRTVFSVLRAFVGVLSWASPSASWKVFGVGTIGNDARSPLVTRLFGVREFGLAAGLQSPEPAVRVATLQAGLVVDGADIVASLIALRKGAPRWIWLTFIAGASGFIGLGLAGLAEEKRRVAA